MSEYLKAIILGIVEGLTEFIPVSSTGHLILFGDLIEFRGSVAATFEVVIQLGAILAVVVLYFQRFLDLLKPGIRFSDAGIKGVAGVVKIVISCLPAFILGGLFHHYIKSLFFFSVPVAFALIVGGVLMIYVEKRDGKEANRGIEELTLQQSFIIGIFQCLSLWPGMSRAASTIVGGIWCGLNRKAAAEFSFLIAVPVICGAAIFDSFKSRELLLQSDLTLVGIGLLVSFITALFAVRFFMKIISRFTLAPFAYYRIGLGIFVLAIKTL